MKIINSISPKIAVIIARKLFTTPIKFKTPKREMAMYEASQKMKLNIESINKEVEILSYGYSDKKVLLAHGWSGRSTQLFVIANKLLENGFMVISFDAPAHGNSKGKSTHLIEFIETVKYINESFGPFHAAIGHSLGGMTLLNVQSKYQLFNCLVTVGSGDEISKIISNFSENLGLNQKFAYRLQHHFEKYWNLPMDDFSSSTVAKTISEPVLVIHDVLDDDVNVSCAYQIRQNLQNGELLLTNRLGHTKILRDTFVTKRIVNFIKEQK